MQSAESKPTFILHSSLITLHFDHFAFEVSVIGLAPIRPDLKGRLRELLCIHGLKWSPRLVSRQRLLVFSEALICLSYSGKWSSRAVTLRGLPLIRRALCF